MQMDLSLPLFVKYAVARLLESGCSAYVVGGAVRDAFLKRSVRDWDLVTDASPLLISRIFRTSRSFHHSHETVTLVDSGIHYEISSFRADAKGIEEDLLLRDFTINAIAFDPVSKRVIDPGGGLEDLRKGLLRAVPEAKDRFREDPLRILRGVRLGLELCLSFEALTLEGISESSSLLSSVPKERIRHELFRMLLLPLPSSALRMLSQTGLLEHVIPELVPAVGKAQNEHHVFTLFEHLIRTADHTDSVLELRLAALLHDIGKLDSERLINGSTTYYGHEMTGADLAERSLKRLRTDNATISRVSRLIRHHMINYDSTWGQGALRRLIKRVGTEDIDDLILLRMADIKAHGRDQGRLSGLEELRERIRALLEQGTLTGPKDLAVDGRTIMEVLDISEGPSVGRIIGQLMGLVLDEPAKNNREDLIDILKDIKQTQM